MYFTLNLGHRNCKEWYLINNVDMKFNIKLIHKSPGNVLKNKALTRPRTSWNPNVHCVMHKRLRVLHNIS